MQIKWQTDHLPQRERFAYWRDAVGRDLMHLTIQPPGPGEGFSARFDISIAGRFRLANMRSSHGNVEKTAGDLARGGSDGIMLYASAGRRQHYKLGGRDYDMRPGDLCIVPMDRSYTGVAGASAFRTVLIPMSVIGPMLVRRELSQAHHLHAGTPLANLLCASLDAAAAQLPALTEEVGDAVLANLSGLVALALNASEEGQAAGQGAAQAARLSALHKHVRQHLSDPLLDPKRAAAGLGMSVRQVHLLFQPTGHSFSEWLLARRLDACMAVLTNPLDVNRSVADVAFGCGFNSLSVFYRAFGAAFGTSPGHVRSRTGTQGIKGHRAADSATQAAR